MKTRSARRDSRMERRASPREGLSASQMVAVLLTFCVGTLAVILTVTLLQPPRVQQTNDLRAEAAGEPHSLDPSLAGASSPPDLGAY